MTAKTIPLSFPVVFGGQTISEVVFRRPKGKDMPLLERLDAMRPEGGGEMTLKGEAAALMIRVVSGLPEAFVDELDLIEDIPRLTEEAAAFLESIAAPAQGNGGQ